MVVRIFEDAPSLAVAAADTIDHAVRSKPDAVLALPTGRTPIPMYEELAARHDSGRRTLSRVRTFNLDELVLPSSDRASFRQFMINSVWNRTGLSPSRADIPNGEADDLEQECSRYENAIRETGGLDLAILGLGMDGHIAYNLPGALQMSTHVVVLPDSVADSLGVRLVRRPLRAITMGLATIARSRAILVMATGDSKAAAVRALLHDPADSACPASLLRSHRDFTLFLDLAAARRVISGRHGDFVAGQKLG